MAGRGNKRWNAEEIKFLQDNIDKQPIWLARELGRSLGSINIKSRKLFQFANSQSGSVTITLPPIKEKGSHYIVNRTNSVITIKPSGSDIIPEFDPSLTPINPEELL